MITGAELQVVCLAVVAGGLLWGAIVVLSCGDPYRSVGQGGEWALDVHDGDVDPLDSPAGRDEVRQLEGALEWLRSSREQG